MVLIPTETEMINICDDLKYYGRTAKNEALVAVARFLKRTGQRDMINVIRNYLFSNSSFTYQDGELIPEHRNIVLNIKNNFR